MDLPCAKVVVDSHRIETNPGDSTKEEGEGHMSNEQKARGEMELMRQELMKASSLESHFRKYAFQDEDEQRVAESYSRIHLTLEHMPDFDFGKVEGMLLGFAVGDALGITTEGMLRIGISVTYGSESLVIPCFVVFRQIQGRSVLANPRQSTDFY
jgi:hypothetical protein